MRCPAKLCVMGFVCFLPPRLFSCDTLCLLSFLLTPTFTHSLPGITIARNTDGVKTKPNEPCPCGSKLKFKKCCFSVDGKFKGATTKTVGPAAVPEPQ